MTESQVRPSSGLRKINQVRENTQAMLRKEPCSYVQQPKFSSQLLAEELERGEGTKRYRIQRAVTESMGFTWHQAPHTSCSRCEAHSVWTMNVSHFINTKPQAIEMLLLFNIEHFQNNLCVGCLHTERNINTFFMHRSFSLFLHNIFPQKTATLLP